ncbi:MAG: hypothetical protein ACFN0W_10585 [Propionibacterium acidifaciens]|uniref:hypothetical protein n=1 Tax=Propionibacterium acidifaciens TaxID=556499 RepID=UPI003613C4C7
MNWILRALAWIGDPAHSTGPDGLWALTGQHLAVTGWARRRASATTAWSWPSPP